MDFPEDLKYTKDHEWIRLEGGGTGTIGITDHAQGELGDVVFVELPAVGRTLTQHDTFGTIEAVKAVSDLYSPVVGIVMETNAELQGTPELVNREPYGKGWMIKVKIGNLAEVDDLLSAADYRALVGK